MNKTKKKIALVRGKFLNAYEMQIFEPLTKAYDITAFGSLFPYHEHFDFPVVKLPSPMDLPDFPKKMGILNRIFTDAHYLYGLEHALRGFAIAHTAETYYHYTRQALHAKKKGYVKKVITTVLENIPFNNEGIWGRKALKKNAREEVDHIIALTKRTKETLLIEGADPQKITVIAHGIHTQRFVPRKNFLNQQGIRKTNFTVLFVGRLEIYKGVYEMLYSIRLLVTDKDLHGYRLHFLFVGEGSEKNAMIALAKKLGILQFLTFQKATYNEMPNIYKKADMFWAPSKPTATYQEQYCTSLLEAQAAGLPIVATLSGGIPENVGDAGILVGPGDFYSLAHAVKEYLLHPSLRVMYAKKARLRAENVHDVFLIAKQIQNVYEKVLQS